jgi:hypothetical protein
MKWDFGTVLLRQAAELQAVALCGRGGEEGGAGWSRGSRAPYIGPREGRGGGAKAVGVDFGGGRHECPVGSVRRGGRGRARRLVRGALRIDAQLSGGRGNDAGMGKGTGMVVRASQVRSRRRREVIDGPDVWALSVSR